MMAPAGRPGLSWLAAWAMLAALAVAGLAGVGVAGASRAEAPAAAMPVDDAREVLVMLRLPAEHFRGEAGYRGGYGGGEAKAGRLRIASRLARQNGLLVLTDWPMPVLGVDCFVMTVPPGHTAREAADQLAHDPAVAWAQPMGLYRGRGATAAPNDSLFRLQPAARQWRLAELHRTATGRNVRVAVIDSMVDRSHPDLVGQVRLSEDFVLGHPATAELHGTGVAGIIAARDDNGVGIVGIAPRAQLMALRACWQGPGSPHAPPATLCDTLSLAKAMAFAIDHKAQVINLSLSGPDDILLGKLIDAAVARGATVVGAFDPDVPGGGFPASHPGVIAVSDGWPATPRAGVFIAPGRDVPTTQPGGRWFLVNGSSYAAAHVSGLFALLHERGAGARGAAALVTSAPGATVDACGTLVRAFGPCECGGCPRTIASSAVIPR
jgi:hypothetical protein